MMLGIGPFWVRLGEAQLIAVALMLTWTPKVCKIMTFWAVIYNFGTLVCIHLGSREDPQPGRSACLHNTKSRRHKPFDVRFSARYLHGPFGPVARFCLQPKAQEGLRPRHALERLSRVMKFRSARIAGKCKPYLHTHRNKVPSWYVHWSQVKVWSCA